MGTHQPKGLCGFCRGGLATLPPRPVLDDLGGADKICELPAAVTRRRSAAPGPRARSAALRTDPRRVVSRAEAREPPQPHHRREHVPRSERCVRAIGSERYASERSTAADGSLRPQPLLRPLTGAGARTGLRSAAGTRTLISTSSPDGSTRTSDAPGQRRPRLFLSELSLPTDHANDTFNFFVSRDVQAAWIGRALRITRSWRRIYSFGYLGLFDPPAQADGQQVDAGLIDRNGVRKPAFDAFKRG